MKIVERAIFELIKNVVPPIGGNEQVFFLRAPANAKGPFIIIQKTDGERWRHVNGPSGMAQVSLQIDVYAPGWIAAKTLAGDVEVILDGYKGIVYHGNDSPQDFVRIAGISHQSETELLDEEDSPILYRQSASYLVTYEQ